MYDTWKHDVTAIDVAEHNPLLSIMVCHVFEFCFVLFCFFCVVIIDNKGQVIISNVLAPKVKLLIPFLNLMRRRMKKKLGYIFIIIKRELFKFQD